MPEKHIAAAIDGPVGAGKSSIAREAAKKLGFIYVDTGALYRAVGLYCHRCGANMKDPADIASRLPEIKPEIRLCDGVQHIYLNGEDVSSEIRLPEISMAASAVSAVPEVRAALLGIQRGIAAENNVIMDGRDIGTVVLPNAQVKIFLTAAPGDKGEAPIRRALRQGCTDHVRGGSRGSQQARLRRFAQGGGSAEAGGRRGACGYLGAGF